MRNHGIILKSSLSSALIGTLLLAPTFSYADMTGNIGVHSKYLLRGIGQENENTAVQGGLDYVDESGLYAGWWASNLGYTYEDHVVNSNAQGFENDFYGGYAGEMGPVGFDVGLIQYVYLNVEDSDLTEFKGKMTAGPFYAQMQYLLNDGWWGNAGDIYWTAGVSYGLPGDFTGAVDLGYYTYNDDDNSDLCSGVTPCIVTTSDSGFRHANFKLSHPIAQSGASMYVQYVIAGEDRTGNDNYDDQMILGITYGFGI